MRITGSNLLFLLACIMTGITEEIKKLYIMFIPIAKLTIGQKCRLKTNIIEAAPVPCRQLTTLRSKAGIPLLLTTPPIKNGILA